MFRNKAQGILELALCFAIAATAIAGMALYIRRSLQARYRAVTDHSLGLVQKAGLSGGLQHEPYYTRQAYTDEKREGIITEGRNMPSSRNIITNASAWRYTSLPGEENAGFTPWTETPNYVPWMGEDLREALYAKNWDEVARLLETKYQWYLLPDNQWTIENNYEVLYWQACQLHDIAEQRQSKGGS